MDRETDDVRALAGSVFQVLSTVYETSPWTLEQTRSDLELAQSVYLLAESGGRLLGFLSASEVMDEVEITNIAVRKDCQGQGISSKLLERLLEQEANFFLEVRRSNLIAQNLYRKYGFTGFHERKNYYKNPTEDAILMRLERL